MSEERLNKALDAVINETVTPDEFASARTRVWEKLSAAADGCREFRPKLKDYMDGRLLESRRLLMEDHLGRCPECRRELGVLRGDRKVVEMPRWHVAGRSWVGPQWRAWAVAACLVLAVLYISRDRIDSLLAPGGPRANVQSVSGDVYRVSEGALKTGAAIGEGDIVRTGAGAHAMLRLADGSGVEVNERSELYVTAAWSGETIHLDRGDIIVQAAKQRRGALRVQTRDSAVSVKGTVFAVSAGVSGSVVSVLEGAVDVKQPGVERILQPGELAASNPRVQNVTVRDSFSWSQDSAKYIALLASFVKIEKQMANMPQPALRTQSTLLRYLPPNAVVFGTAPNLTGTLRQALSLAEEQANESDVFKEWWTSDTGQDIRSLFERVQEVTPMFGDEIGFVLAQDPSKAGQMIPILFAEVQAGKRDAVTKAMDALPMRDAPPLSYQATDGFILVSDSSTHVQWATHSMGLGAASLFAADIAQRYQKGVSWLVGVDVSGFKAGNANQQHMGTVFPLKHVFFEHRVQRGDTDNSVTFAFQGPRTGIASWLASNGSNGAAEYVSGDALFAFSASTREPRQVFEEFTAEMSKIAPKFPNGLQELQAKLGINVTDDIAGALGTDFAFAIERPTIPIPSWVAAVAVNSPSTLDHTIGKLVEAFNSENSVAQQPHTLALTQETVNGRVWNTLKSDTVPVAFTWTYDGGYLIAGSDRALVGSALATRNGGSPLIWTAAFQQQLPASAGLHPAGFAWLNTKGVLQGVSALISNPVLQKLASERDPVLVVLNGETEQIRASSRTGLTSLVLDAALATSAQLKPETGNRKSETAKQHDASH